MTTGNDDAWLDDEGNWHVDIESAALGLNRRRSLSRDQKEMDAAEAIVGVAALFLAILLIITALCF